MTPDQQATEANRYRIERLERDVHELVLKLDDYTATKITMKGLEREVGRLSGEFDGLRKALYTAALTIAGSTILLAVSVLVAIAQ
jgi:hypothetical protein